MSVVVAVTDYYPKREARWATDAATRAACAISRHGSALSFRFLFSFHFFKLYRLSFLEDFELYLLLPRPSCRRCREGRKKMRDCVCVCVRVRACVRVCGCVCM